MEFIELQTPIEKHKVKIKKYLTGRDSKELNALMLKGIDFSEVIVKKNPDGTLDESGANELLKQVKGDKLFETIDKQVEVMVVEVDGSTEGVYDKVLDMHSDDYDFVVNEVTKIVNILDMAKKKVS